jgi:hypothetical protein
LRRVALDELRSLSAQNTRKHQSEHGGFSLKKAIEPSTPPQFSGRFGVTVW